MAVQKNRKTRSKRGMRRSHHRAFEYQFSRDPHTGELHRRHHVTPYGFYRGRNVLNNLSR